MNRLCAVIDKPLEVTVEAGPVPEPGSGEVRVDARLRAAVAEELAALARHQDAAFHAVPPARPCRPASPVRTMTSSGRSFDVNCDRKCEEIRRELR